MVPGSGSTRRVWPAGQARIRRSAWSRDRSVTLGAGFCLNAPCGNSAGLRAVLARAGPCPGQNDTAAGSRSNHSGRSSRRAAACAHRTRAERQTPRGRNSAEAGSRRRGQTGMARKAGNGARQHDRSRTGRRIRNGLRSWHGAKGRRRRGVKRGGEREAGNPGAGNSALDNGRRTCGTVRNTRGGQVPRNVWGGAEGRERPWLLAPGRRLDIQTTKHGKLVSDGCGGVAYGMMRP